MKTERVSNKKGRRFKRKKGKSNRKKVITILLIAIVVIGIGSIIYFSKNNENSKTEESVEKKVEMISSKLLEEKTYKEMKIKDISLKVDESASYFKCNLENVTDKKFKQEDVFFVFVKEDNSEVARFKYQINLIEAKAEEKISIITTNRLTDVYDFYIEEVTK